MSEIVSDLLQSAAQHSALIKVCFVPKDNAEVDYLRRIVAELIRTSSEFKIKNTCFDNDLEDILKSMVRPITQTQLKKNLVSIGILFGLKKKGAF